MSNHPDTNETNKHIALELTKLIINNPQSQNNLRLTKELKDNPKIVLLRLILMCWRCLTLKKHKFVLIV